MLNVTKEDKLAALEKFSQNIWNMYVHLSDGRSQIEDKLNYFLAFATIFIFGYIQVFHSQIIQPSLIHWLPPALLMVPILLLLTHMFAPHTNAPWFPKELLTSSLEQNETSIRWIVAIYNCASMTYYNLMKRKNILRLCYHFLWISLIWITYIFCKLFEVCYNYELLVVVTGLTIVYGTIATYRFYKRAPKEYDSNEGDERLMEYFTTWINGEAL